MSVLREQITTNALICEQYQSPEEFKHGYHNMY